MSNKTSNEMSNKIKAVKLVTSMRGEYILSQALYLAIEVMEKVKGCKKEPSNISDMKYLMKELFPIYSVVKSLDKRGGI